MALRYSHPHSTRYKQELANQHEVVVISDLLNAPEEVRAFYRQIKEACERAGKSTFLPIDFLDLTKLGGLRERYQETKELSFEKIRRAGLVVAYLGYQGGDPLRIPGDSTMDAGKMLGEAKLEQKPQVFIYEAEKEGYLRRNDPKIWWQPKSREEIRQIKAERRPYRQGPMIITPTSTDSFLIPDSVDPNVIKEILFRDREQALSELEEFVSEFR